MFPGIVAMVGDRDGLLYEGAFGRLSVDGDEPVRADTMFWIASMTKAIVSVAAIGMIERGELELEQPVADVIPAFGELPVLEGFDGDEPRLRPARRQATIRHLFTHTSGLGYWFSNADVRRYHEVTGLPDPFSGSTRVFELPLLFDAGERWEYGISLDWLGQVVETVSGQDLETHCRERIFEPLGMRDSTFLPTDDQRARAMAIHTASPAGPPTLSPIGPPGEQEFLSAGGGLFSTCGDYTRFLRALLRGGELEGERVLTPESVELAFSDHLHGAPLPAEGSKSAVPELSQRRSGAAVQAGLRARLQSDARGPPGHAPRRQWQLGRVVQLLLLRRPRDGDLRDHDDAGAAVLRCADHRRAAAARNDVVFRAWVAATTTRGSGGLSRDGSVRRRRPASSWSGGS